MRLLQPRLLHSQRQKSFAPSCHITQHGAIALLIDPGEDDDGSEVDDESRAEANAVNPRTGVTQAKLPSSQSDSEEADGDEDDEREPEFDGQLENTLPLLEATDVPKELIVQRTGLHGELETVNLSLFSRSTREASLRALPRFELIPPMTKLADSVNSHKLKDGSSDFMRGIFYYAGLDPDKSDSLFEQNSRTQKTLKDASSVLDRTLRQSWSQGKELQFVLQHNSAKREIELLIEDPSVDGQFVYASRRSSGFTHYFSLKTILHARKNDHAANSYVLLFDEPGVFLHPSGQFDLLQVLETLSRESQIVYVTHSLFMINKTFPTRHRFLMKKGTLGTVLEGKPYVGRWESVLNGLGLTLTGSILFANHVLLTEGDSDPIYLYSLLQKAIDEGHIDADLNSFAIMSTTESRNAEALLRILLEGSPTLKIAMLFDGDKGGKERFANLKAILEHHQIQSKLLPKDIELEDYLPMQTEVLIPAVAEYAKKLKELGGQDGNLDLNTIIDALKARIEGNATGKQKAGFCDLVEEFFKSELGFESAPSKVGIAREYATKLLALDEASFKLDKKCKELLQWICEACEIPPLTRVDNRVLEE